MDINWGNVRKLAEPLVAAIYPRRCPVCDGIVAGGLICPSCEGKMTVIREPYCMKCGKELADSGAELCDDCRRAPHVFLQNRAVFRYTKAARGSIVRFKFHNKREYADYYADTAKKLLSDYIERIQPDVIVPVPMYRKKKVKRGYNQAEVFAVRLAEEFRIPCVKDGLLRVRHTTPLKELSKEQRREELAEAFYVDGKKFGERNTALVTDDIYTTGATLDACSRALLNGKSEKVYGMTLAIGAGLVYNGDSSDLQG